MRVCELITRLTESPSGHTFTAAAIKGKEGVYLGVDQAGHPCLFVRADQTSAEPALRTAHVSLRPSSPFRLIMEDGTQQTALFHALCCETTDRYDLETFLVLIDAFTARQEKSCVTVEDLFSFFHSMVRLFAMSPARDLEAERQGLWGELFVMSQVRGFMFWGPFWHSEVTRLFDLSAPTKRVEVKTTVGGQRIHHFSHRQIYATEGQEIVIASVLLRQDDAGLTLRRLLEACRVGLQNTPYYLKVERAARKAGMTDPQEHGPAFDVAHAQRELAWFHSTDAPHFRMPEPPGVSETRYKVDLSIAPRLDPEQLESWLDNWAGTSDEPANTRAERLWA